MALFSQVRVLHLALMRTHRTRDNQLTPFEEADNHNKIRILKVVFLQPFMIANHGVDSRTASR